MALALIATAAIPGALGASRAETGEGRSMPIPVAYEQPQVTIGASTARLRGRQTLYRINATTGQIVRQRRVDFGAASTYRSRETVRTFGGRPYIKLTRGPYRGWWVNAPTDDPASSQKLSETSKVRIRGGDRFGVRFYANGTVKTRRAINLSSAATYAASRRAKFFGRTFFYVTEGPFANRWVSSRVAKLVSGTIAQTSPDPTPTSTAPAATWKTAVLIYRETDVTFTRSNGSTYRLQTTMSATMRDLVGDVIRRYRNSVSSWSDGLAAVDLDVIDVPHAITSLNKLNGAYWVGPDAVENDLDRYAPTGTYDSIIVVWDAKDDNGVVVPVAAWGLSLAPGWWANGAGYTSLITPTSMTWWTQSPVPQDVFVHEWLHQAIFFHENAGRMRLDLHTAEQYGYTDYQGTWKSWYSDVMRGLVRDGGGYIGISREIWAAGTPRNP
jgi:hypothetical protein